MHGQKSGHHAKEQGTLPGRGVANHEWTIFEITWRSMAFSAVTFLVKFV